MSRLKLDFTPYTKSIELLDSVQKKIGRIPNIYKLLSYSPNLLEGYINFSANMSNGALSPQDREHIALIVAGFNQCEYCASAHTIIAKKAGLNDTEITANLHGKSEDPTATALLNFCLSMLQNKGKVTEQEFTDLLQQGYSNEQIVEIIASIAIAIFTSYFNNSMQTDIDFPKVTL